MDEPLPEMMDNPIQSMFIRHQQRFMQGGGKRISYPREYKIAAIDRVKAGNTRYKVAKELNITESMLGKWVIKYSEILALKKGARRAIAGRKAKFPLLEDML